ncbi:MAG: hypothetical protein JWQ87_4043 [Candidatus Sulfotelmatobacter sp.]|nr:hypothetical protein [Candidatus Sulfotelmatobacter sp.]
MEVQQQHVCDEPNHEPQQRFHEPFESGCHDLRIPFVAPLCQVNCPCSGAVGSRLDAEMVKLRLKSGAFQTEAGGRTLRSA